jgi:hypothetical protein
VSAEFSSTLSDGKRQQVGDNFRRLLAIALLIGLCLLPIVHAFQVMCTHWVAVPWWDEWWTPGQDLALFYRGALNWSRIFSAHNEHRLVFPRLILVPIALVAGWDVRQAMMLSFLGALAISAGLYRLLQSCDESLAVRIGVWGIMNGLLFAPAQYENFLLGMALIAIVAVALILGVLINLSARSIKAKVLLNGALSLVATYSYGNGMLLWLLLFPIDWSQEKSHDQNVGEKRLTWWSLYLLAAAVSIGCYFISYEHPSRSPELVVSLSRWPELLQYLVVWLGDLFLVQKPAVLGSSVLLLFILLAVCAFSSDFSPARIKSHYPWLVLGCYAVISGMVTAAARLGFGLIEASDHRYTSFTVFLYLAVVGLAFSVYRMIQNRRAVRRIALAGFVIGLIIWTVLWEHSFRIERSLVRTVTKDRKHLLLVMRWSLAIPDNPDMKLLTPYPETPETIRTLAAHDALRPRLVSTQLAQAVRQPPLSADGSAGFLDSAVIDSSGHLEVAGWARIPDRNRPPDCVVIGYQNSTGSWKVFSVTQTGIERPDIATAFHTPMLSKAGFSRGFSDANFLGDRVTLRAWSVDLKRERAFPMAGAIVVGQPSG